MLHLSEIARVRPNKQTEMTEGIPRHHMNKIIMSQIKNNSDHIQNSSSPVDPVQPR